MKKVAVVTDSSANIPTELVQQLNIHVVPIPLMYGTRTYLDGVDITAEQVYRRLRLEKQIPTTSAPSVGDFLRVYATASEDASGIVSIHMSTKLSSTYNTATVASQLLDRVPVRVVNCGTAAMGQGFVVLEAARAAAAGATLDEVVSRANEIAPKVQLLFTLDTLEYLHRSGRVSGVAALMGSVLQIKPVVYLVDGHVEVLVKARTRRKAIQAILDQMSEQVRDRPLHVSISHADAPAEAEKLRRQVEEQFHCMELYVTEFTPVMGAHTGPGVLGVAFYAEEVENTS
ncbi:MAG: DegV family protein [Anaerolineae bacterium]